jgi:hypothetical protein
MWWWIASFGYSNHNDVFKYCLAIAILAAAAETIPPRRMQAAHTVATMSSATKISNAAIHFYCEHTLICLQGRVCCVMCFCILLDSTQSLETHYKMQHKYFLTGFRK